MNFFAFCIRHILDSFRSTSRIVKHYSLVKLNGFSIIFKIFFIRFFNSIPFIRNFSKPIKRRKLIHSNFFNKSINLFNCVDDIDIDGFSKTFNLKSNYQNKFLQDIFDCKNLDVKKLKYPISEVIKKKNEHYNDYCIRLKKMDISRVVGFLDLSKPTELKKFLTSKELLSIVQSYLNTKTISISASFFISNPLEISDKKKYENAQFFHWDNDFRKFLKLYIYLSDVDENSGPHIFIKHSHKIKNKNHRLCRLYPDSQIYENYPSSHIIKFNGKSGSTFFVDSYGLHKGETPIKRSRILLNIHFGIGKILYNKADISVKI